MIAELDKALYGLREAPLLWYNEISETLKEAGIDRTDEEPLRLYQRQDPSSHLC